jgi:hypothetical protein
VRVPRPLNTERVPGTYDQGERCDRLPIFVSAVSTKPCCAVHVVALGMEGLFADWQHSDFPQPASSLVPAYLMIQFEPDRIEPDRYYLSHWRQSDSAAHLSSASSISRSNAPGSSSRPRWTVSPRTGCQPSICGSR